MKDLDYYNTAVYPMEFTLRWERACSSLYMLFVWWLVANTAQKFARQLACVETVGISLDGTTLKYDQCSRDGTLFTY